MQRALDQTIGPLAVELPPDLHRHCTGLKTLLREVLQTERDEALDRYFASIDRTTPYMERACMAVLALAAYLRNNRTILTAAFQVSARNRQIDESQAEWLHAGFRDMVQAGVAAGEFRDLPLDATVRMLVGTIMLAMLGIGNWAGEDEKPELPETLVTLTRAILAR